MQRAMLCYMRKKRKRKKEEKDRQKQEREREEAFKKKAEEMAKKCQKEQSTRVRGRPPMIQQIQYQHQSLVIVRHVTWDQ